jgi:hypothetical protein
MKRTPEEFKVPAKSSRPNQHPRPQVSASDQADWNPSQPDDPQADVRRHDSGAASDATVPPIDSLEEDSDMKGFMSPNIGEYLRRSALRKFFHLPKFNRRDGLDDYDEDFKAFQDLGDILTSDMRYHLDRLTKPKTVSGLKTDPPEKRPPEAIEESAGMPDPKSSRISSPESTDSIPDMYEIAGRRNSGTVMKICISAGILR